MSTPAVVRSSGPDSFSMRGGGPPDPLRSDLAESVVLVRRAQAGEKEALERLFARYLPRLHRIARIRMGARLRQVMESMDLVQRANEVALRKLGTFEPREHAGIVNWLEKILENQMRDARRAMHAGRRDVDRELPIARSGPDESSSGELPSPAGDPTPSQAASCAELERIYDACVEELAPDHREVILERDYAGGSWAHVCERLGRPSIGATQELHRRARIQLALLFGRRTRLDRGEPRAER